MVSLLLTDPPYGVSYEGKAGSIKNDNLQGEQFKEFLTDCFNNAFELMEEGASFYVWYASREHINFETSIPAKVRQVLIWNKNSFVLGRSDYQNKFEPCLYGWKDGASHKWYSDRSQTTVLDFNKPLKSDLHPTMKPVDLFCYLIGNSTKIGDIVLDIFGGSGTTLIACETLKRKARLIEFDPRFADVIVKRWLNLTKRKDEVKCIRNGEEIDISEFLGVLNENS